MSKKEQAPFFPGTEAGLVFLDKFHEYEVKKNTSPSKGHQPTPTKLPTNTNKK